MPKFLRENIYCLMDSSLVGKAGFFEDNAAELRVVVENNNLFYHGYLLDSIACDTSYPFMQESTKARYKFFYHDPYWDLKCSVENGDTLEVNLGDGWIELKLVEDFMSNPYNPIPPEKYRTVPKNTTVNRTATHLELAKWLAYGYGQACAEIEGGELQVPTTIHEYFLKDEHKPVTGIRVRAWCDTKWVVPTTSYLGLDN